MSRDADDLKLRGEQPLGAEQLDQLPSCEVCREHGYCNAVSFANERSWYVCPDCLPELLVAFTRALRELRAQHRRALAPDPVEYFKPDRVPVPPELLAELRCETPEQLARAQAVATDCDSSAGARAQRCVPPSEPRGSQSDGPALSGRALRAPRAAGGIRPKGGKSSRGEG